MPREWACIARDAESVVLSLNRNRGYEVTKGYVIARITVTDPKAYADYARASAEALKAHGGTALVRAGEFIELEGQSRPRNVVLEFPSFEQAQAYYRSAEYQTAKAMREGAAVADIIAIQGAEDLSVPR